MQIIKSNSWEATPDDDIIIDGKDSKKGDLLEKYVMHYPMLMGYLFFPKSFKHEPCPYHSIAVNYMYGSGAKWTILKIPRGFGKTTLLTNIILPYDAIFLKIKVETMISAVIRKANSNISDFKNAINGAEFRRFFGSFTTKKQKSREGIATQFFNDPFGVDFWLIPFGLHGAARGEKIEEARPEINNYDDPDKDTKNPDLIDSDLEKIDKVFEEMLAPTASRSDFQCRSRWFGTPLGRACLLKSVERFDSVRVFSFPAMVNGESTWPGHWSTKRLERKRDDFFNRGKHDVWYSEYQVHPNSSEVLIFRGGASSYNPNEMNYLGMGLYMTVDVGLTVKSTSTSTAIIVGGYDNTGTLYVIYESVGKWRPEVTREEIIKALSVFRNMGLEIKGMGIESSAFDYIYENLSEQLKKNNFSIPVSPLTHENKHKVDRIARLIPWHEIGKLKFNPSCKIAMQQALVFPTLVGGSDSLDSVAHLEQFAVRPLIQIPNIDYKIRTPERAIDDDLLQYERERREMREYEFEFYEEDMVDFGRFL